MNKEQLAQEEWNQVLQWAHDETEKVTQELRSKGRLVCLDTNKESYKYIHDKVNQRLKEIQEKYKTH